MPVASPTQLPPPRASRREAAGLLVAGLLDQDPRGPVYGLLFNGTGQLALSVTGS
jgi:hypothetical protein